MEGYKFNDPRKKNLSPQKDSNNSHNQQSQSLNFNKQLYDSMTELENERKNRFNQTQSLAEKELIISQLKSELTLLQLNQKEFDSLKSNYEKIIFDYNILYDQKRNLEYQFANLEKENRLLNKQYKEVKEELLCKIKEKDNQINKLYDDNAELNLHLDKSYSELESFSKANISLQNEYNNLIHKCEEMDKQLQLNKNTITDINSKNLNLRDKEVQLYSKLNEIERLNKELSNANDTILKLKCELKDNLKENNDLKNEILDIKSEFNNKLAEVNDLKIRDEKLFEDNCKLYEELDILKSRLLSIVEQNTLLIDELAKVRDQDNDINYQLQQRDYITQLLNENKIRINSSLNFLNDD